MGIFYTSNQLITAYVCITNMYAKLNHLKVTQNKNLYTRIISF